MQSPTSGQNAKTQALKVDTSNNWEYIVQDFETTWDPATGTICSCSLPPNVALAGEDRITPENTYYRWTLTFEGETLTVEFQLDNEQNVTYATLADGNGCLNVSHVLTVTPGNGSLITVGANTYAQLADTDVTGLADGNIARWVAANNMWEPVDPATLLGEQLSWNDLSDVDMATTAPVAGNVGRFDGAQWVPVALGLDDLGGTTTDATVNVNDQLLTNVERLYLSGNVGTQMFAPMIAGSTPAGDTSQPEIRLNHTLTSAGLLYFKNGASAGSLIGFEPTTGEAKITNLRTPTADADAVTKKYSDDQDAAVTAAYTAADAALSAAITAAYQADDTALAAALQAYADTAEADAVTAANAYTDAKGLDDFGGAATDADVDLNAQKLVNVATPTADQDAATKKYVDDALSEAHVWSYAAYDAAPAGIAPRRAGMTQAGTSIAVFVDASSAPDAGEQWQVNVNGAAAGNITLAAGATAAAAVLAAAVPINALLELVPTSATPGTPSTYGSISLVVS